MLIIALKSDARVEGVARARTTRLEGGIELTCGSFLSKQSKQKALSQSLILAAADTSTRLLDCLAKEGIS